LKRGEEIIQTDKNLSFLHFVR